MVGPFYEGGCQFWFVNYGNEFCHGCAFTRRYGYCGLADMGARAPQHQHKNQWYFNTGRLFRCHVFKNYCETQWKSMVCNLACVLAMWQIVVFGSCNILHILRMYLNHFVSFRFGIQAALGPDASLSSLLQTALAHETTVCVTFGARWRNTYFCPCRGC